MPADYQTISVGLTGSIGTGKSTTVAMLRRLKIPVQDSDAIVHTLLKDDLDVKAAIAETFPEAVKGGTIDRPALRQVVFNHPIELKKLENILHPYVYQRHLNFIAHHQKNGTPLIVLDIPLLFEVGWQEIFDVVVVTNCDPFLQQQRVLARPGMTEQIFKRIIAEQWPADKKKAHADYVLETGHGRLHTFQQVKKIMRGCKKPIIS